jgi:tRNA (guanine37-N1)-methyltransferase
VPDVLMSGNHRLIEEWRAKESLRRTYLRRPDLLEEADLTKDQKKWLEEIKKEGK